MRSLLEGMLAPNDNFEKNLLKSFKLFIVDLHTNINTNTVKLGCYVPRWAT